MRERGVPTSHAQAVMGHASGTVTFDTYGSGVPVERISQLLKILFEGHRKTLGDEMIM